jgi:iron complex outermembrane receptor protein
MHLPRRDVAGDRWSDVNPVAAFPYVRTGAYVLANVDASSGVATNLELAIGLKNLLDDNYELAWGFPAQGRTFLPQDQDEILSW